MTAETYLVSYPRSGNTLLRYLIEHFTNHPTDGMCDAPRNPNDVLQEPLIWKGRTDYIVRKMHHWPIGVHEPYRAILILRDYKECLIRHNESPRGISLRMFEKQTAGKNGDYIGLLKRFDEFEGDKLLLHYEDWASKFTNGNGTREFFDLIEFLKTPYMLYDPEAVDNISHHARNLYPNPQSGSDLKHHQKKLNIEEQRQWDDSLQSRYPNLYDKYLKHYKTQ